MIPLERTALSSAETWAGDVQPLDEAVDEEPAVTKCCPDRAEEVTTDEVLTCFGVVMMVVVRTVSGVTRCCCILEDEDDPTPTPPPLIPTPL